jgi:hypothetical protein
MYLSVEAALVLAKQIVFERNSSALAFKSSFSFTSIFDTSVYVTLAAFIICTFQCIVSLMYL